MVELNPSYNQELCYTAQLDRLMLQGIVGNGGVARVQTGALLVTTGASGLNLSVAQGGGWMDTPDDDRGIYFGYNDAAKTVTATANASGNPRIDQVIATVNDTTYGEGTDNWVLSVLAGTATVGATLANLTGAAALPDNSIRLAYVLVPNGFAGPFVNATHILDARLGYVPAASMASASLVRVFRNGAFTVPVASTDLVFDTISFGNSALFNTTTGVYTAPATGIYRVSAQVNVAGSATSDQSMSVSALVNGVVVASTAERSTTTNATSFTTGCSFVVSATLGQAIKVQTANSSAGAFTGVVGTAITFASFERIA